MMGEVATNRDEFDYLDRAVNDHLFTGAIHYCLTRELLPAVFPPWAGSLLFNQPGELKIPLSSPY